MRSIYKQYYSGSRFEKIYRDTLPWGFIQYNRRIDEGGKREKSKRESKGKIN